MNISEALKMAEDNIQQVSIPLNAHAQIQRIFANVRSQIDAAAETQALKDAKKPSNGESEKS